MVSPRKSSEFELIPKAVDAINRLNMEGWTCVVVTNQPDLSRGLMPVEELKRMHEALISQVGFIEIRVCPHDDVDNCSCRKPLPGLILQAASELEIELSDSWMIGDRISDMHAGIDSGCKAILIKNGQSTLEEIKNAGLSEVPLADSLWDAIDGFISKK
jgi:D-glycero-D-manno-heptose 1,7-bisphosphate phosphatase